MLPAVFPQVAIVRSLGGHVSGSDRRTTVRALCREAEIPCLVEGPPAERAVHVVHGSLWAAREPGPMGAVLVAVPAGPRRRRALLALGVLAYAVFDYAARECLRGRPEARLAPPAGRPRSAAPLTGAERQARWRARRGRQVR